MNDGAIIRLTVAVEMDRTGHIYGYNERIQPDQFVAPNYKIAPIPGSADDPVLKAGVEWLRAQLSAP
jgi:hypothetical protein